MCSTRGRWAETRAVNFHFASRSFLLQKRYWSFKDITRNTLLTVLDFFVGVR